MKNKKHEVKKLIKSKDEKSQANPLSQLKQLNLGDQQGFTCDAETGICSPTNDQKEVNK